MIDAPTCTPALLNALEMVMPVLTVGVGVNVMVGVIEGVIEIVGVIEGVIEIVGVIVGVCVGVLVTVGVGGGTTEILRLGDHPLVGIIPFVICLTVDTSISLPTVPSHS